MGQLSELPTQSPNLVLGDSQLVSLPAFLHPHHEAELSSTALSSSPDSAVVKGQGHAYYVALVGPEHYIDYAALELKEISQVLGLKA